jgi:serine protease AprX
MAAVLATVLSVGGVGGIGVTSGVAHATTLTMQPGVQVTNADDCANVPSNDNYDGANDAYSLYNQKLAMGTEAYYNAGDFGQGIGVALIDTGVAPVAGLDNVVDGPDLSFESQAQFNENPNPDLAYNDAYGHGTHMAGIIAGRDVTAAPYGTDDPTKFSGVAPDARILNMKVADAQGAVDTTQIIAAVDWIVQHKDDSGLGVPVKIINLSYGIRATDIANKDALAFALEQAWAAGIFVVVSAGNDGTGLSSGGVLPSPGNDRAVMTVGSYDYVTRKSSYWTSAGSVRHPDVVAPGEHVQSLHVPGSSSDDEISADCTKAIQTDGSYRSPIFGTPDAPARFVRGSGTSQSAAMVSGVAALVLSQHPTATPPQIKRALVESATSVFGSSREKGAGKITLDGTHGAFNRHWNPTPGSTYYSRPKDGRIDESRGADALPCLSMDSVQHNRGDYNVHLQLGHRYSGGLCSSVMNLKGRKAQYAAMDIDIQGNAFDQYTHELQEQINPTTHTYVTGHGPWTDDSQGEKWNGAYLTGNAAALVSTDGRSQWTGHRWSGNDWSGHRWSDFDWSGHRWSSDDLTGHRWSSDGLAGHRWSDESWTGHRWSGNSFSDLAWG